VIKLFKPSSVSFPPSEWSREADREVDLCSSFAAPIFAAARTMSGKFRVIRRHAIYARSLRNEMLPDFDEHLFVEVGPYVDRTIVLFMKVVQTLANLKEVGVRIL
jgi:hypothetical protein